MRYSSKTKLTRHGMLPPLASGATGESKKNLLSSAPSNEKRNKIEPISSSVKALTQRDEQPVSTERDATESHETHATEKPSEQAPKPEKP